MKQKLLLIFLLSFFCSVSFAQSSKTTQNESIAVTELKSVLSPNGTAVAARASNSGANASMNVQRLAELITQVQSSTYFYSGVVKTYGEVPTNLYTDFASLRQVNSSITGKQSIEVVTIVINTASELNSTIDLAAFSNFTNLKYIYFISNVNTTSENIASHIANYDTRFNIFYKIDKGDRNQ